MTDCPVCLEQYNEGQRAPKNLSCGHTVCLQCLLRIPAQDGAVPCPTCRQLTPLPPGGPVRLPTSYGLLEMVPPRCEGCSERPASGTCVGCTGEPAMCPDCHRAHVGTMPPRLRAAHTLQPLGQRATPGVRCSSHPELPRNLFCEFHKVAVCPTCAMVDHHGCGAPSDVARIVPRLLEMMDSRRQVLLRTLEDMGAATAAVRAEADGVGEEAAAAVSSLVEYLGRVVNETCAAALQIQVSAWARLGQCAVVEGEIARRAAGVQRQLSLLDSVAQNANAEPTALAVAVSGEVGVADPIALPSFRAARATVSGGVAVSYEEFGPRVLPHGPPAPTGRERLVVCDNGNNRLQVVDPVSSSFVRTIGSAGSGQGQFCNPRGVCPLRDGTVVVSDMNHRLQVIHPKDGSCVRVIGGGCGAAPNQFHSPRGICSLGEDTVVVADYGNHRLQIVNVRSGSFVRTIGSGPGSALGQFNYPTDICVLRDGTVAVCDYSNHRLQVVDPRDGRFIRAVGNGAGAGPNQFQYPAGICALDDGTVAVSDHGNSRVQIVDPVQGTFLRAIGQGQGAGPSQLHGPWGICVLSDGTVAVCDYYNSRVQIVDPTNGSFLRCIGGVGSAANQFQLPTGVCVWRED